jgi:SET domain-containing protein
MLRQFLPSNYTISKRSSAWIGLYAAHAILKGQKVIEYTGNKVTTKVADTVGGKYLFTVNSRYTILGNVPANKARYINHSCFPNCEPRVVGWRIFIYAIKNIKEWEELCYNYGKDYFTRMIQPFGCRCIKCKKASS